MKVPTEKEQDDVLNRVDDRIMEGGSKYPGMSYEEGIANTIRWMRGDTDDSPYEDEEDES